MNAANSNDLRIVEFLINHVKNINIKINNKYKIRLNFIKKK